MHADNFYIALYDDERRPDELPYYVDAFDVDVPDPDAWEAFGVGHAPGHGLCPAVAVSRARSTAPSTTRC